MTKTAITSDLTDEEAYLYAILQDHSGLDLAEFSMWDGSSDDGCFRAWPFQYFWWRSRAPLQIDCCARSVGKSLSILARMFAFPFRRPGQEAVITAPELIHLEPIINLIENRFFSSRLGREMLQIGRSSVTHRPFMMNFRNGARIMGRIPQRDGKGVKGIHPLQLEMDECFPAGTLVLTRTGMKPIETVEVGDRVLTHRRRWRPVTAVATRQRPTVNIRGHGHPGIVASENHPFWACRDLDGFEIQSTGRNRLRSSRFTTGPEWIPAQSLKGCFWSSPTVYPQVKWIPAFRKPGSNGVVPCDQRCPEFFWMVGLYIAEGSTQEYKVSFSVHTDEALDVQRRLRQLGVQSWTSDVQSSENCKNVVVSNVTLARWLAHHCGSGAHNKRVPSWALGIQQEWRQALLEGLVYGDGFYDPDRRYAPGRWKLTTASHELSVTTRMLANTLGYWTTCFWIDPPEEPKFIRGRPVHSTGFYQVVGNTEGQGFDYNLLRYTAVREVEPTGRIEELYDLTVDEDHSFIAEGYCVSNSQDYPRRGWTELNETLKRGFEGSEWRAHGVTRGVRDKFYEYSQDKPTNPWKVHKYAAMWRPTWTDEEREEAITKYGGHRDDPDYRRNVLGEHGDPTAALFIVTRLMACVDDDESSDYNQHEYAHLEISDAMIGELGPDGDPGDLLVFPVKHAEYPVTWCGMDVGLTHDPSEILVFGEYHPSAEERKEMTNRKKACPKVGLSRFKLLSRISLKRVTNPDQLRIILGVIAFYRPKVFSLDKTGIGLPLYQDLLAAVRGDGDHSDQTRVQARAAADVIKGYNFAAKVVVEIDDSIEVEESEDQVKEAGIHRNVLEQSTDTLRTYVDTERLWLPWDDQLVSEFEGQTFSYSKSAIDQFGRPRRIFSEGRFHALDAARMFAMGHGQQTIEAIVNAKHENEAVIARFYQPGQ